MKQLWTWRGIYFGYRSNNNLWTYNGKHVGRFYDEEVYDSSGRYLGELRNGNRLITHRGKKQYRKTSFTPFASRMANVPFTNYIGYVMLAGYEDFPPPSSLH